MYVSERCGSVHVNVVQNDGQHVSSNDFHRPGLQDPHSGSQYVSV